MTLAPRPWTCHFIGFPANRDDPDLYQIVDAKGMRVASHVSEPNARAIVIAVNLNLPNTPT